MGQLSEYCREKFGVDTRYNPSPLINTVDATALQVWSNNPDRLELVIVNLSANVLYVNIGPQVSSTNAWRCGANGGAVVFTAEEDGALVGYPFWVVGSAPGTDFFSAEVEAR